MKLGLEIFSSRLQARFCCPVRPRLDLKCCLLSSFVLITMFGLAATLVYFYLFHPVAALADR